MAQSYAQAGSGLGSSNIRSMQRSPQASLPVKPLTDKPLSLYLHIPFCSARCGYCAFNTYIDLDHLTPRYVAALCQELRFAAASNPHAELGTVYFGGGTPSLLSAAQFERILQVIHDSFTLGADVEISLEANPDDLSGGYLRELRALGCNRLSIGMQSANAAVLRLFDRQHDLQAVADAVSAARGARFDNLNLDVIFGSPGETLADWRRSLAAVIGFAPEHISMYGLELKGGTALRQRVDAGELPQPDDDVFADMYEHALDALAGAGYAQYEISNWHRQGKTCRHNLQYWRNLPYLGLGAGAHGFAGGIRYTVMAAPQRYIAALEANDDACRAFPLTPTVAKHTQVSREDDLYETIMMGMRLTQEGILRSDFVRRFGQDIVSLFPTVIERLLDLGMIELDDARIRLSRRGLLLSNGVIRQFVEEIKP